MKLTRSFAAIGFMLLAGFIALTTGARSQTYPTNNPAYIPTATSAAQTIPTGAATNFVFLTNGVGTMYIRIAGSPTGLAATVGITEARTGTITYTAVPIEIVGGTRTSAISAAGLYRINTAGAASIQVAVSALTSGVTTIAASMGTGEQSIFTLPNVRSSYSASAIIATGATVNFIRLSGSATKTVRVTNSQCSGKATAAIAVNIDGTFHSAADTGDAGTAITAVPHDSTNAAATSAAVSHTTSPTQGAVVGKVRSGTMTIVVDATPITPANVLNWDFGTRPGEQQVTLRGVAQGFSLSTSAAFGSGAAVGCSVTWTEE